MDKWQRVDVHVDLDGFVQSGANTPHDKWLTVDGGLYGRSFWIGTPSLNAMEAPGVPTCFDKLNI